MSDDRIAPSLAGRQAYDTSERVFLLFGRAPKTNAEKRRAVIHLLDDPGLCNRSDAWIAQQCCVSRSLVVTVRKEREHVRQTETDLSTLWKAWSGANETARTRFSQAVSNWKPPATDEADQRADRSRRQRRCRREIRSVVFLRQHSTRPRLRERQSLSEDQS